MFYQHFKGVPLEAYDRVVQLLKAKAMTELKLPESELIVRPLRPEDIGFPNAVFASTIASSGAWTNMVNTYTIADMRFVGLTGIVYDLNRANIVQLRVTRSGKTSRLWSIQQIRDFEDKIGFADDPITVDQNTQLTIERYATTAVKSDKTGFVGVVVERRGLVINP